MHKCTMQMQMQCKNMHFNGTLANGACGGHGKLAFCFNDIKTAFFMCSWYSWPFIGRAMSVKGIVC